MNREDLIRMAREAGLTDESFERDWYVFQIERFAALVAAAEREACAKVCEEQEDDGGEWDIQQQCANAIRARGNT